MLPQVRLQPWYPGQVGVPGSDVPRGLRWRSAGVVFYVDADHPNATATADGTDPENPLSTITAAMARLVTFHAENSIQAVNSVVVVAPGTYTETIAIDQTNYPDYCTILAGGNGQYPVIWAPAAAADSILTIDAYGWLVDGIHFQPGDTGCAIELTRTAGAGAEGTVIHDCFFNGGWGAGGNGIELNGAPANVSILNNRFAEFARATPCIVVTATGTADPYQTHIIGNTFQESAEYIDSDAGGWNASVIAHNVFASATPELGPTTTYINLGNGSLGYNVVTQNVFGGLYSNAGGYTAEAGGLDNWVGNIAQDVGSGQVADNGFTVALPV
jgi:hypothetical protein